MIIQPDADLLAPTYSPRRIRFFLRHLPALEALAQSPSTSAGEAERLGREWELLLDRRGYGGASARSDCLCHEAIAWPDVPASPGGGRHMESAEHPWSDLLADLAHGVEWGLLRSDALCWRITHDVCAEMGMSMLVRWEAYEAPLHGHAGQGCRKPLLDPHPTLHMAATIIAAQLGWVGA